MKLDQTVNDLRKWRPLLALLVTLQAVPAIASKCQQALNQREVAEILRTTSLSELAEVSIGENRVRLILREGNWSQKTEPVKSPTKSSTDGRVENAFQLKTLLQEQSGLPEFQKALAQPNGHVEIDLSAVKRISSDVLGTLLMFQKYLLISYPRPQNMPFVEGQSVERLRLTGVQPDVYSFLQMAAMDKVLSISLAPRNP